MFSSSLPPCRGRGIHDRRRQLQCGCCRKDDGRCILRRRTDNGNCGCVASSSLNGGGGTASKLYTSHTRRTISTWSNTSVRTEAARRQFAHHSTAKPEFDQMEFVDTFDTSVMEGRHLYLFLYALPFFFKRNILTPQKRQVKPSINACLSRSY